MERQEFLNIRPIEHKDIESITQIYNHYIKNSIATFEEEEISIDEMGERVKSITSKSPWLVAEKDHQILGYAYLSSWKPRSAYRFSSEITVYVNPWVQKKGVGSALYSELFKKVPSEIHRILAGISQPNEASVALHEKFGFVKTGQFNEIGFKLNQWIDVGYWELSL